MLLAGLLALASSLTYAGYLVVGVGSEYLHISRFFAGLLLGMLFARFPWISQGKLTTVGLLPKQARQPVMLGLLAVGMLHFLFRGNVVPLLFLAFAAGFLLTARWMRRTFFTRVVESLFGSLRGPVRNRHDDASVIDAEFREKKD